MLFNLIGDSAVAGNFFNMGSKHERSSSSIFAIESQLEVILLRVCLMKLKGIKAKFSSPSY